MSFGEKIADLVNESLDPILQSAQSWQRAPLAEIVDILNGYPWPSSGFSDERGQPVIRIRNVLDGETSTFYEGEIVDGYWVFPGDLLVGMDGDFNRNFWNGPKALLNQRVCKLTTKPGLYDARFLYHVLPGYLRLINEHTSSVTVKHLSSRTLGEIPLPLPPLAEQKRIASKLDVLNAKSARARTELARIETLVSRYKQAVLSKAFSGELTREWQVVSLDLLSETVFDGPFGSNLKSADYTPNGPRVVRLENIGKRKFIEEKRTHISEEKFHSLSRHKLQANDLLFSSFVSEEIRACLFPSNAGFRAINKADCFCIRLDKAKLDPKFALLQLTTEATYTHFVQQVHGATRPRINLSQLKRYPLVVPALDEQHEIVRRIESAFAKIDRLAKEANRATELVGRLNEAMLAKAFRGELVPQDPNDEPASALIERVGARSISVIKRGQGRPAKSVERAVGSDGGMTAPASPLMKVAGAMTAQQKDSSVSKTRHDPDVMGQPYLSKILRKQPGAGTVDALFKAADLPVADFYKQLAWEIENQHIRDKQDRLEAA